VSIRKQARFFCPIEVTLSVLTGKWKPLIIFNLKNGPRRFSALQAKMPHISHKVLTQQLRALEVDRIIVRERAQSNGNVAYELTEFGRTLRPSLTALANWGQKHHPEVGVELAWRA
jgi:DNA-binding HxlR family transcriptional regulator